MARHFKEESGNDQATSRRFDTESHTVAPEVQNLTDGAEPLRVLSAEDVKPKRERSSKRPVILGVILGAVVGNTLAYSMGRWLGQKIYTGHFKYLNQEKLLKARDFYDRHGGKTVLLGRFIPIARAFIPLIAGAAGMKSARFELYSVLGAVVWAAGLIGLGYLFGNIPIVRDHLTVILLGGIAAALSGPVIVAWAMKYLHKPHEKRPVD